MSSKLPPTAEDYFNKVTENGKVVYKFKEENLIIKISKFKNTYGNILEVKWRKNDGRIIAPYIKLDNVAIKYDVAGNYQGKPTCAISINMPEDSLAIQFIQEIQKAVRTFVENNKDRLGMSDVEGRDDSGKLVTVIKKVEIQNRLPHYKNSKNAPGIDKIDVPFAMAGSTLVTKHNFKIGDILTKNKFSTGVNIKNAEIYYKYKKIDMLPSEEAAKLKEEYTNMNKINYTYNNINDYLKKGTLIKHLGFIVRDAFVSNNGQVIKAVVRLTAKDIFYTTKNMNDEYDFDEEQESQTSEQDQEQEQEDYVM